MAVTNRIAAVITDQYGVEASSVISLLEEAELRVFGQAASERFAAAIVIVANGSIDNLLDAIRLMEIDWRDLLVEAELADSDWLSKVDDAFGKN